MQANQQGKDTVSELKLWETLERRLLVDRSPWMRLFEDDVRLPDGQVVEGYLRLETNGYVMVVPIDPEGKIGLVRSYKRGVDAIDLQPPAGIIDSGETALDSAKRELLEELGCEAEEVLPLGSFVLSGNYYAGRARLYLALDCVSVTEPNSGDLEEQQVVWIPYREVRTMWLDGTFQQMGSVAALGLAFSRIESLEAQGHVKFEGQS